MIKVLQERDNLSESMVRPQGDMFGPEACSVFRCWKITEPAFDERSITGSAA